MPRGRMQHTAALPRSKSCSAYAANAIASTWKKNFLQTCFRLPKLWNEISELGLIFFSNWLMPFWNPLLICRAVSFDATDNLPIKFLGHAASNGRLQPSQLKVHIYLWHVATFAAQSWHTWPLCAAQHSVDVPLRDTRIMKWEKPTKTGLYTSHFLRYYASWYAKICATCWVYWGL